MWISLPPPEFWPFAHGSPSLKHGAGLDGIDPKPGKMEKDKSVLARAKFNQNELSVSFTIIAWPYPLPVGTLPRVGFLGWLQWTDMHLQSIDEKVLLESKEVSHIRSWVSVGWICRTDVSLANWKDVQLHMC